MNATPDTKEASTTAYIAAIAGWFVPGLGHFLLKRRGSAAVFFLCVAGLALTGYSLHGQVYSLRGGDVFGFLGHLAEIGGGAFFILARFMEPTGADISRITGDFGTRFLVTAGLLNYLCLIDAWQIARRARS